MAETTLWPFGTTKDLAKGVAQPTPQGFSFPLFFFSFFFLILYFYFFFFLFIFCIVCNTCHNIIGADLKFDGFRKTFGQKLGVET